jgi:UDP-glucose 4-epimerase
MARSNSNSRIAGPKESKKVSSSVLVTGGAGYIGSHAYVALVEAGYHPVVVDNFSNAHSSALKNIEKICGAPPVLFEGDIRDETFLADVFSRHTFRHVLHFAGLKAVGESTVKPLQYYDNNVRGTLTLLQAMKSNKVRSIIFSSSATVYGDCDVQPVVETAPRSATNPYGQTKLVAEFMLEDLARSDPDFAIASLRYFNPVGAHPSGLIGENPNGIPNNLMPFVAQVASGRRPELSVFGSDYPTADGTGVRDFIHVMDLVEGHVAALKFLEQNKGFTPINLGVGRGVSVLEMVKAFEVASGKAVPYKICDRRPGDVAVSYADPARAKALLGWTATRSVADMCSDSWRWQQYCESAT